MHGRLINYHLQTNDTSPAAKLEAHECMMHDRQNHRLFDSD